MDSKREETRETYETPRTEVFLVKPESIICASPAGLGGEREDYPIIFW